MKRQTVIILSILVILALAGIYWAVPDQDKQNNEGKIILRTDIKDKYTIDDMISQQKPVRQEENHSSVDTTDAAVLARIQNLIQENEQQVTGAHHPVSTSTNDTINKRRKTKIKNEKTQVQVQQTSKQRMFNGICLNKTPSANSVRAFVHSTQTVMVGATLKMQIAQNCMTDDGHIVRAGTPVYGEVTQIDGERVKVKITTININNNILPFEKDVYSQDALEGIYVPGNAKAEVTQDAEAGAVAGSNMNVSGGIDMGSQLAAGAINGLTSAGKSAVSKNIRKIKVTIKTNYQLLLMQAKE